MRPLPLWAALLLLSAPASAQECAKSSIGLVAFKPYCETAEKAPYCHSYASQVMSACREGFENALAELDALSETPRAEWSEEQRRRHAEALERAEKYEEVVSCMNSFQSAWCTRDADRAAGITPEDVPALYNSPSDPRFNILITAGNAWSDIHHRLRAVQDRDFAAREKEDAERDAKSPPVATPERPGTEGMDDRKGLALKAAKNAERARTPMGDAAAAGLYEAAGRDAEAERAARRAAAKDPKNPDARLVLAGTAYRAGRHEDALREAEETLRLRPGDKRAQEIRGYALTMLRGGRPVTVKPPDLGGAGADAAGAAGASGAGRAPPGTGAGAPAAQPGVVRALPPLARRALDLLRMNDHLGALEAINRHIDAEPSDHEALLIRSDLLLRLGKPEAALKDAEAVLTLRPGDARALRAKAAALLELGRHAEALAAIDEALALEPASGAGHFTRAKALEALGRTQEAIAAYRKAAALDEAVAPLAEAALARLGAATAPAPDAATVPRRLLRGGMIAASLALILLGLIGGAVVVTRRRAATRAAEAAARAGERTLRPGDLVARQYRIVRELGRGGMGVVFEAVDETLKRPVALKQLQSDFRMSAEDAARFLQEARLVAQVRHPNVAEIYAAVEDGGLFLVFELVRGRSLDAWAGAGLTPEQARGVVASACAALEAAHARRIVHRDLKPSNLMVGDDGVVKVMDFGIAHQSRGGAAFTQTAASGTPPYMAPEQAMGTVSASSDLYALAVMAYELLCGKRPFEGPDFLGPKLRGEFRPLTARRPGLPARLDAFFESALAADPAKRPADAKAFRVAFDACWS